MAKTFGCCRQEIVHNEPSTKEVKERWPALFQDEVCSQSWIAQIKIELYVFKLSILCTFKVNVEFLHITTRLLESTLLRQLDKRASKHLEVTRKNGGSVGDKMAHNLCDFDQVTKLRLQNKLLITLS